MGGGGCGVLEDERRLNDFSGQPVAITPAEVARLADRLFREESAKLVSVLTGLFGPERLQMAEDVVQEALARALQTWPFYGVPKKPAAWLTQTAKNLTIDLIRRESLLREKQPEILATLEQWPSESEGRSARFEAEIADDTLRLMFTCCHPAIPQDAQVALALKTLCGFGAAEIASAFLAGEAAIEKRLVRARQRIRELRIPFAIPAGEELDERLDSVLHTLYLLFNEGHKASTGESLTKSALCEEAIRLCALLAGHSSGNKPRAHALLALMLLTAARLPARTDSDGNILRLQDQDRSKWSAAMIARGMSHLQQSGGGEEISAYHLQAGIAACHALAPDYASTDWNRIVFLYNKLAELDASPVVLLNRAVAIAELNGPHAGLEALGALAARKEIQGYYLYHAARGEFLRKARKLSEAAQGFARAAELTEIAAEKRFLQRRARDCAAASRA